VHVSSIVGQLVCMTRAEAPHIVCAVLQAACCWHRPAAELVLPPATFCTGRAFLAPPLAAAATAVHVRCATHEPTKPESYMFDQPWCYLTALDWLQQLHSLAA
jgi:hypothetical protein